MLQIIILVAKKYDSVFLQLNKRLEQKVFTLRVLFSCEKAASSFMFKLVFKHKIQTAKLKRSEQIVISQNNSSKYSQLLS